MSSANIHYVHTVKLCELFSYVRSLGGVYSLRLSR